MINLRINELGLRVLPENKSDFYVYSEIEMSIVASHKDALWLH